MARSILILAALVLAGCAQPPVLEPSALPGPVLRDHLTVEAPTYQGPLTLGLEVVADGPVSCTGSWRAMGRDVAGLAALVQDIGGDVEALPGSDLELAGLRAAGVVVHSERTAPYALSGSLDAQVAAGATKRVWIHIRDVVADEDSGLSLELRCPGATIRTLAGVRSTPITWVDGGDLAVDAVGQRYWVAASDGPSLEVHEEVGLVLVARGPPAMQASFVVATPDGPRAVPLTSGPESFEGAAGRYELRGLSYNHPPIGAIVEAGPVDLAAWLCAAVACSGPAGS